MKDVEFDFNDECLHAFNVLKEKLTTASVLMPYNWKYPFDLMCDASGFALGAILG